MAGHAVTEMHTGGDGLRRRLRSPEGLTSVSQILVMEWPAVLCACWVDCCLPGRSGTGFPAASGVTRSWSSTAAASGSILTAWCQPMTEHSNSTQNTRTAHSTQHTRTAHRPARPPRGCSRHVARSICQGPSWLLKPSSPKLSPGGGVGCGRGSGYKGGRHRAGSRFGVGCREPGTCRGGITPNPTASQQPGKLRNGKRALRTKRCSSMLCSMQLEPKGEPWSQAMRRQLRHEQ